jgi:hypothetical protein
MPHATPAIPAHMLQSLDLLRQTFTIANRAAIADIETECVAITLGDGLRWYDTRPMIDPREHCGELLDMATQTLAYADAAGLIARHPQQRHMVRLTLGGKLL